MYQLLKTLLIGLFCFLVLPREIHAQAFQIVPAQIDVVVAPGFNHADVRVPITGVASGFDIATLTGGSDVSWVKPSIDTATREVVLTFTTSGLLNSSNTATVTVTGGGTSDFFSVRASVAPLNLTKLLDDPFRSRMYGLQQNGANAGAVVAIDPLTNTKTACVTVGKKPTDLAISPDGTEMVVINAAEGSFTAIDLATLRVKSTTILGSYANAVGADTTGDIAYGSGNVLYYTDGSWAPILYVYNRATGQVLQQVTDNTYGVGDLVLSPNGKALYLWQQYGWSAGLAGSNLARYTVAADGKLTFVERTNHSYPSGYLRDPLDTPILIDSHAERVFAKQHAVNPLNLNEVQRTYPTDVYSISPGGEIAATKSAVFEVNTNTNLLTLPVTTGVQAITSDYARLIYFNQATRTLGSIDLIAALGSTVLNRNLSPVDGAITLSPQHLNWNTVPGVDRYRVYLGTVKSGVENATVTSPEYLGEVTTPSFPLNRTLTAGTTYYWRVDAISSAAVSTGVVFSFTISPIAADLSRIETATVQGHSNHSVDVALNSPTALGWQATSDADWLKLASATGTSPGTLTVVLDASRLSAGLHSASVTVKLAASGNPIFTLPVTLQVDPLNLTRLESDRTSATIYALSEEASTTVGLKRAYLLEIDSSTQEIKRVVRAGSSATDLAVHYSDNRIYVANWRVGALLAFDKDTLKQVRSYGFRAFSSTGYGGGDVYRIAAGTAGRLMVEEQDQWIEIDIFDTAAGVSLATRFEREGGGKYSPDGQYYYHGDNNSSGAEIHKFDVTGDVFTELAHIQVVSASGYGSRTVVVSENGERVFWNGGVFDENLTVEWLIGEEIHACSPDGRYAFSRTKIYDVEAKAAVLAMPVTTTVSAYNGTSKQLVVQSGSTLKFYSIGGATPFPAPVLSAGVVTSNSVQLNWTDASLESSFTLQWRLAGAANWTDTVVPANTTSYTFSDLGASRTYQFRIKADANTQTSAWSEILSIETPAIVAPALTTQAASQIGMSSAVLRAIVNPNGNGVQLSFEYGLDTSYGASVQYHSSTYPYGSVLTGNAPIAASALIAGLIPGRTYHFRVKVSSPGLATIYGEDQTFTTIPAPQDAPTITSLSANAITATTAVVQAGVNARGAATSVVVEYAGRTSPAVAVGSGNTVVLVDISLTGLRPATTYAYRLIATNSGGSTSTAVYSFDTLGTGGEPSSLTANDDIAYTIKGEPCVITPTANDVSSTRDALRITRIGRPSAGSATINGNQSVTYVPGSEFAGVDEFSYEIADTHGNRATATITVRSTYDDAAGIYVGLVGEVAGEFEDTGLIQITVTRAGAITGRLFLAGTLHRVQARLRFDGVAAATIPREKQSPLTLTLQLDPEEGTLTGGVSTATEALAFNGVRVPYTTQNPSPALGRYTILLQSEDPALSPAHGVATVKVGASGSVLMAGRTSTGARFSAATYVDGTDRFSLYAVPAQARRSRSFHGRIQFRETTSSSHCDGPVGWSERDNPAVSVSTLIGSRYLVPSAGTLALPFAEGAHNAQLDCWDGSELLTSDPVRATLKARSLSSSDARIVKLAFVPGTGFFSGNIRLLGRPHPFYGVVFQAQGIGAGLGLLPGGPVEVQLVNPAPAGSGASDSSRQVIYTDDDSQEVTSVDLQAAGRE